MNYSIRPISKLEHYLNRFRAWLLPSRKHDIPPSLASLRAHAARLPEYGTLEEARATYFSKIKPKG